jgi:transcriptional regulator with XRE-family HTH domain
MISISTNDEIARELGTRLREYRLQRNLTAQGVANRAGLQLRTVLNAELGRNPTLETLIKVLRALGRLDAIDAFLPPPGVSPIALMRSGGRPRRRASKPRHG